MSDNNTTKKATTTAKETAKTSKRKTSSVRKDDGISSYIFPKFSTVEVTEQKPKGYLLWQDMTILSATIKDIEFLLASFSSYHQTHPSCFLCIIGSILDSQYAQQVFSHLPSSHLLNLPSSFIPSSQKGELYEGIFYMRFICV